MVLAKARCQTIRLQQHVVTYDPPEWQITMQSMCQTSACRIPHRSDGHPLIHDEC